MRAACVLLTAALLTACATPRPSTQPGETPWTSGRLSVRIEAAATQAAQAFSAGFELRGDGDSGELRLISPLGTRLAAARWAPGVAVLQTPQGEQRYATLDDLSRQALGEALPLTALADWVKGQPWPGAAYSVNDTGFEQLGWQVLLAKRAEGLIEARRSAPPGVTVRVRLDNDAP
jgi:outer membrane lipoprotein LolB